MLQMSTPSFIPLPPQMYTPADRLALTLVRAVGFLLAGLQSSGLCWHCWVWLIHSLLQVLDTFKMSCFISLGSITFLQRGPSLQEMVSHLRPDLPFPSHLWLTLSFPVDVRKRIPQQDNHLHSWRQCLSGLLLSHSVHFQSRLIA